MRCCAARTDTHNNTSKQHDGCGSQIMGVSLSFDCAWQCRPWSDATAARRSRRSIPHTQKAYNKLAPHVPAKSWPENIAGRGTDKRLPPPVGGTFLGPRGRLRNTVAASATVRLTLLWPVAVIGGTFFPAWTAVCRAPRPAAAAADGGVGVARPLLNSARKRQTWKGRCLDSKILHQSGSV